jgi:type I restriction enzyme M protein
MNMILQGDGHSGVNRVNSLANPRDKEFDVIVSNIPFSQKTKYSDLYYAGIAKNNGDAICILHCLRALKDGGRMALVVPEGFLYRDSLKDIRKFLLENSKLQTVVSLPQGVFLPYTMAKTDILYFTDVRKKRTEKHFFYFDIKNDGYSLNNHRKKIQGSNDLQIVNSADFKDEKDILSIGFNLIDLEEVKQNNYSLVGNQYGRKNIKTKWPEVKLEEVILDIKDGGTPSRKVIEYFNGGIHWCIVKDIKPEIWETKETISELGLNNSSAKIWPIDSVIISLGASIGYVGIAKVPVATKQGLSGIIVDKQKIMPEYLFYVLTSRADEIRNMATGTTIKEVRPNKFKRLFRLPLPPLEIQKKIVQEIKDEEKKVKEYKSKIEITEKNIKNKLDSIWEK